MKKANKGEWSEFYAFLKILFDHKLFSADETFTIIPDSFFNVLSIIKKENKSSLRYIINEEKQAVEIFKDDQFIAFLPFLKIGNKLNSILKQIQTGSDSNEGVFGIQEAEELMEELNCSKLKASSREKSDITITLEDTKNATIQDRGFSIKSQLGGKSTLFNPSGSTNFKYKLIDSQPADYFGKKPKIDLAKILTNKSSLLFESISSKVFEHNLSYIDSFMPILMSEIIKYYYLGYGPSIKTLTEILSKNDPLKKNDHKFYQHKIGFFLVSVALGMQPSKPWHGDSAATGGYIVVKKNGELVCYHIYDRDRFMRYLFANTCLDTPSRTRFKYGKIYEENGFNFIKLNLQIRFTI